MKTRNHFDIAKNRNGINKYQDEEDGNNEKDMLP